MKAGEKQEVPPQKGGTSGAQAILKQKTRYWPVVAGAGLATGAAGTRPARKGVCGASAAGGVSRRSAAGRVAEPRVPAASYVVWPGLSHPLRPARVEVSASQLKRQIKKNSEEPHNESYNDQGPVVLR